MSQGISNYDIHYVEPNEFGVRMLRVNNHALFGVGTFPGSGMTWCMTGV